MKRFAVVLIAVVLLGCAQQHHSILNATNVTPNEVMGMVKIVCLKGEPALKFVQMMHIGKIRFVKDIAMMHYISPNSSKFVTVWVTVYPNSSVAKEETDRMAKSMIEYGWKDVKTMKVDDMKVYYVRPPGRNETHYFWCKDNYMIYIIPHNMSSEEIREFILKVS